MQLLQIHVATECHKPPAETVGSKLNSQQTLLYLVIWTTIRILSCEYAKYGLQSMTKILVYCRIFEYGTQFQQFTLLFCKTTHIHMVTISPIPSPITSSSSDSPLCSFMTPSLFHSRLKTYLFHKSYQHSFTSSSRTAFTDYCLDRFF